LSGAAPGSALARALSPSLQAGTERGAFEFKYLVDASLAAAIEARARRELTPDPHGEAGRYATTTLYLDTAALDLFRRRAGFGGRKHRVRRYGDAATWFVERKTRRGDHVTKQRCEVAAGGAQGVGWFADEIASGRLAPAARLTYERTAFFAADAGGAFRLTLDRALRGARCDAWRLDPVAPGSSLLGDAALLELKFAGALPECFKSLLADYRLTPSRVSKYRRFMSDALGERSAADDDPTGC